MAVKIEAHEAGEVYYFTANKDWSKDAADAAIFEDESEATNWRGWPLNTNEVMTDA